MIFLFLLLNVSVAILLIVLVLQCLKIKSSRKDPEFAGTAGTLVRKDPDDDVPRRLPAIPDEIYDVIPPNDEEEDESSDHPYARVQKRVNGGRREVREPLPASPLPPELPSTTTPGASQINFSGDSQDSTNKGYTSISVREPIGHVVGYATVSEASDGVYAAIDDPGKVDNSRSNSVTYAVIDGEEYSSDPKGGKTLVDDAGYSKVDKRKKKKVLEGSSSSPVPSTSTALEDMYAKVQKRSVENRDSVISPSTSTAPPPLPPPSSSTSHKRSQKREVWESRPRGDKSEINYSEYEVAMYDRATSRAGPLYAAANGNNAGDSSDGYETLPETSKGLTRKDSNNYEVLSEVRRPGISRNPSAASAGYETVTGGSSSSKRDPPYAELIDKRTTNQDEGGYETIPRNNDDDANNNNLEYDPNYEFVAKSLSEPAYETIESKTQIAYNDDYDVERGSLIQMSVRDSELSPERRRPSVVVIERVEVDNPNEINTHIFV